jgi:hypothetical protein
MKNLIELFDRDYSFVMVFSQTTTRKDRQNNIQCSQILCFGQVRPSSAEMLRTEHFYGHNNNNRGVVTARHKNVVQFIPHKTALFVLEKFLFKKPQNKRQSYATAK